ncbi:hypothetical protein L6164_016481 [Bauhinia variegata]|uniref:Uncharacterized protein n=1 Tax=Bauhinia variegata TaxID=167791 RepID=A0ACB9NR92_BAUVA|nr:hypothetical protein L6164_016481 [Bauhinia variegata]
MAEDQVKLHGAWASPFNCRVIWALKLKGIAYKYIGEDLSNKSPQLLQYNPVHKKIPVLVHGGKPICESMIIVEYIDEIWPQINPLLPADPYERAQARFWVKFAEEMGSVVWSLFYSIEGREKATKEALEVLEVVENQCLGEKKFFGGDNISIVDIAFGAIFHWLQVIEEIIDLKLLQAEKFPHLHSWINNFRDVPVIKDGLPDHEELLAFFKGTMEKLLASSN